MAYDDSEALQPNSTYNLGGYSFELKVQTVHEPGEEDVVSVFAICRSPDGTRETVPMDFPAETTVESWTVEANETEASVYVNIKGDDSHIVPHEEIVVGGSYRSYKGNPITVTKIVGDDPIYGCYYETENVYVMVPASLSYYELSESGTGYGNVNKGIRRTFKGKNFYTLAGTMDKVNYSVNLPESKFVANPIEVAYYMLFPPSVVSGEYLVARFAIDLSEADGGPDGDWDEPGDTGDPSYTLNVSVTGASSGSNSGIPLEAQEQSVYGSGGYGGNGGGGGAGASTVIIYEFATDKAGTVNQEATAQGPGTGGPGGKGGKGGDGCILIFY